MVKNSYESLIGSFYRRINKYISDIEIVFFRWLAILIVCALCLGILIVLISWIVRGHWKLSVWIIGLWLLVEAVIWLDVQ